VLSRVTCWRIHSGEASCKDWVEYVRRGQGTPGGERESEEDFVTGICIWSAVITSHLLILLDKDEQEDLDSQERTALRRMVAELKRI